METLQIRHYKTSVTSCIRKRQLNVTMYIMKAEETVLSFHLSQREKRYTILKASKQMIKKYGAGGHDDC
jgi:hypothetical protein